MVYRGRPSEACSACRARRIKCDKLRPQCSQCVRVCAICPGYPDPLDQLFRDESTSVAKRAKRTYKKQNGLKRGYDKSEPTAIIRLHEDTTTSGSMDDFSLIIPEFTLSFNLSQSVEDIALSHFMSSYLPGRHFAYLPSVYTHSQGDSVLHTTVNAASVATLARKAKQPNLMAMARRSYTLALLATNVSLADPSTATTDRTLISVLLLSLFEAIVWTGTDIPASWATHSEGAFTLIKMRGPQQLATEVGRELFVQVANIIGVNHLRARIRPPQELLDLVAVAMYYAPDCPKCKMTELLCEVTILVADIIQGGMPNDMVVDGLQRMDEKYVLYAASLVPPWHYEEIVMETLAPDMYSRTIHQYASHRAAQLWNSYRMIRIMLNEMIHGFSERLAVPIATILQAQAVSNVQRLVVDICASTPQFTSSSRLSACVCTGLSDDLSQSILLPLSVVKHAGLASEDVRVFATERLKVVAQKSDIVGVGGSGTSFGEKGFLGSGFQMYYLS